MVQKSDSQITNAYEFVIAAGGSKEDAKKLQFAWDYALPLKGLGFKKWVTAFRWACAQ